MRDLGRSNLVHYVNVFGAAIALMLATAATAVVLAQSAEAQTYNVIYNFTFGSGDSRPEGGMILNSGNLFGTVAFGGVQGFCCGVVFELTTNGSSWTFSPLYSFNGNPDGFEPSAIDFGPDGNIYGTTLQGPIAGSVFPKCGLGGGGLGCGTVFRLEQPNRNLGTWAGTLLYTFTGGSDGGVPAGDLAFDGTGNIYGEGGYPYGEYSGGVVYELMPSESGWIQTVLHQFHSYYYAPEGSNPTGGLIMDHNGALYGVTAWGGDDQCSCGTVFQLVPSSSGWTENVLYIFKGGEDGGQPIYRLVFDNSGNLYGTTTLGGANGFGTVFELSPGETGWTITTLHNFTDSAPQGQLAIGTGGTLYSSTWMHAYKMTPLNGGWSYSDLHVFTCDTGCYPAGKMAVDANGNVYGMTQEGGMYGYGVVFEITP